MHHHTISDTYFIKAQADLRKANSQLNKAVFEMERKIYTEEEQLYVSAIQNALVIKLVEGITKLIDSGIIENAFKTFTKAIEIIGRMDFTPLMENIHNFSALSVPNLAVLAENTSYMDSNSGETSSAEEKKKYQIIQIQEEDYGCEGIPDGKELVCDVLLQDDNGVRKWIKLSDSYLKEHKLNEGDVINL